LLIGASLLSRVSHNLKAIVNVLSVNKATLGWLILIETSFIVINSSLVFSGFGDLHTILILFLRFLVGEIRFVFDSEVVHSVLTSGLSVFVATNVFVTFARAEKFRWSFWLFFFLLFLKLFGFLNRGRAKIFKSISCSISIGSLVLLRLTLLSVVVQCVEGLEVIASKDALHVLAVTKLGSAATKLNVICISSWLLSIGGFLLLVLRNHVVRHFDDVFLLR